MGTEANVCEATVCIPTTLTPLNEPPLNKFIYISIRCPASRYVSGSIISVLNHLSSGLQAWNHVLTYRPQRGNMNVNEPLRATHHSVPLLLSSIRLEINLLD